MQGVEHNGHEKLTLLELVLQLHGEFRRSLEPPRNIISRPFRITRCHHEPGVRPERREAVGRVQPPFLNNPAGGKLGEVVCKPGDTRIGVIEYEKARTGDRGKKILLSRSVTFEAPDIEVLTEQHHSNPPP